MFDSAAGMKGLKPRISFRITARNQDGLTVYSGTVTEDVEIGVPSGRTFDREVAIPMQGMPDGSYRLSIEALDPVTGKPIHKHETAVEVIGERVKQMEADLAAELAAGERERPFVRALADAAEAKVVNGVARIPIGVEDGSGVLRQAFPVRLGVPLPKGVFTPDAPARLFGPDGKPVDAQFRVMNVWPDKSLKWLQVDFLADCPANGFVFYAVEVGAKPASATIQPDLAVEKPDCIEICTGPMLARVSRKAATVPGEVFLDRNGDGRFDDAERVVDASKPGDLWWEGEKGQMCSMVLDGKASGVFKPGVSIESNGPMSAVVKVQGWFQDKAGARPAYGEMRIEAFKGKAFLKVWRQITFTGSPWSDRLVSYGFRLRAKPGGLGQVAWELDGQEVIAPSKSELRQWSPDRAAIYVAGKPFVNGQRASGAVSMRGISGGFLGYQTGMWQRFPKKMVVDADAGIVEFHDWPKEAGVQDFGPNEEFWIPSSSSAEACGTGASRTSET
ncbi:MAG TPA: hypothetical protein P5137_18290, partial [Candidatus Brocadiia bacterium]|nr:hypothetical protein [Candidatus Brocadiia bacterium]